MAEYFMEESPEASLSSAKAVSPGFPLRMAVVGIFNLILDFRPFKL